MRFLVLQPIFAGLLHGADMGHRQGDSVIRLGKDVPKDYAMDLIIQAVYYFVSKIKILKRCIHTLSINQF